MKKTVLWVSVCAISLLACFKQNKEECPGDIVCTAVFAQVNVSVIDEKGKPAYIVRTETRAIDGSIFVSRTVNDNNNIVVADDNDLKKLTKSGTALSFKAFVMINGQEMQVVDQIFIIGHDCCHVIKISGPDTIKLDCTFKCEMADDAGPCNAAIPKAYFDKTTNKCKTFIWGGCGPYPFDSIADCEACTCH